MVSNRKRAERSLGTKINKIDAQSSRTARKSASVTVVPGNFEENAVDNAAIGIDAVQAENIRPGSVGTNELGIVEEINSGSVLNLKAPGGVQFNGIPQYVTVIPGAANLNTYTTQGIYEQPFNANAASGSNYPNPQAGLLEVFANTYIWQRYTVFSSGGNQTYTRGFYSSSWSAWKELQVVVPMPSFYARGNTTLSKSGTSSDVLMTFAAVVTNYGGNYNSATSRFTAPVAGFYEFRWDTVQQTAVGGPELRLYVNGGVSVNNAGIGYTTAYMQFGGTAILELSAGDYVQLYVANNNNTSIIMDLVRSSFSGKRLSY